MTEEMIVQARDETMNLTITNTPYLLYFPFPSSVFFFLNIQATYFQNVLQHYVCRA